MRKRQGPFFTLSVFVAAGAIVFVTGCKDSNSITGVPLRATPLPPTFTPTPRPPTPTPFVNFVGAWTGTFNPSDLVDCDPGTATATLSIDGANVSGTLNAVSDCGFTNVILKGTISGFSFTGAITGDRFLSGSTATGTTNGPNLEITLTNSFGFIPGGTMNLHR